MVEQDIKYSMSTTDDKSPTKAQRSIPASILKQLCDTAATMCYDYVFGGPTLPMHEMQLKLFNMYHGCDDLNMVSQGDLLRNGKGNYSNLYNVIQTVVMNTDEDTNKNDTNT